MPDEDWRPKLTQVDDPIADDYWEYVTPQGQQRTARLTVGRPIHHPPARAWYCPILIEGYSPKVDPVFGQGPVDALMNAMGVVKAFFEQNFSVVPGATPKKSTRKKSATERRQQVKVTKLGTPTKKPRKTARK